MQHNISQLTVQSNIVSPEISKTTLKENREFCNYSLQEEVITIDDTISNTAVYLSYIAANFERRYLTSDSSFLVNPS